MNKPQPPRDHRNYPPPGEDPGTLTDEEYLSAGGPDALDAAGDAEDGIADRSTNEATAGKPSAKKP